MYVYIYIYEAPVFSSMATVNLSKQGECIYKYIYCNMSNMYDSNL